MLNTSQESVPQILYEKIWCFKSYRSLNFSYNTKLFIYPTYQFFEVLLGIEQNFPHTLIFLLEHAIYKPKVLVRNAQKALREVFYIPERLI